MNKEVNNVDYIVTFEEMRDDQIVFSSLGDVKDVYVLYVEHERECCEYHYWYLKDLSRADFEGLKFDFSADGFFEMVDGYGIRLLPLNGHPISIPCYYSNNGYYSNELTLVLEKKETDDCLWCYETSTLVKYKSPSFEKEFDITKCQADEDERGENE